MTQSHATGQILGENIFLQIFKTTEFASV